jgi:hypothetical protein
MMSLVAVFCQEFQISTQSHVDLSGIHPLKRMTLIALRYLFGVSLAITIGLQFGWIDAFRASRTGTLGAFADSTGLTLSDTPNLQTACTQYRLRYGNNDSQPGSQKKDLATVWQVPNWDHTTLNPLHVLKLSWATDSLVAREIWAVSIHHAWLISITAALYLFTRWRIRRTARLQSQTL